MTEQTAAPVFVFPSRESFLRGDVKGYSVAGLGFLFSSGFLAWLTYLGASDESLFTRIMSLTVFGIATLGCIIISVEMFSEMLKSRNSLYDHLQYDLPNTIRPESFRFSIISLLTFGIILSVAIYWINQLAFAEEYIPLNYIIIACLGIISAAAIMLLSNSVTAIRDRILCK